MTPLIDTHTHLYLDEFQHDMEAMIQRVQQHGISRCYLPAINSKTHEAMLSLEASHPETCIAMMGLHPCYVKENYLEELNKVEQWLTKRKFAAIGECGLDFYWDKTFVKEQYLALEQQIEWAIAYQLPIVLHTRNATQETIDVIAKHVSRGLTGIFHCFGGSLEEAKQITDMGFYLGIGGVVTYKNAGLDLLMKDIDLKHVVLETDSPYLTPVPHRGKRNESTYLAIVNEKLAAIKGITAEEVAAITTQNALTIFEGLQP